MRGHVARRLAISHLMSVDMGGRHLELMTSSGANVIVLSMLLYCYTILFIVIVLLVNHQTNKNRVDSVSDQIVALPSSFSSGRSGGVSSGEVGGGSGST